MAQTTESSINFPQLIAVALVGFFAIRWYLSKPSTSDPGSSSSRTNHASSAQIDLVKIEQVASMFPQSDRREIAWDLQRNGWNVAATTERILAGRALDTPPHSFQPVLSTPNASTSSSTTTTDGPGSASSTNTTGANTTQQNNLIERYNLQSRIGGKGKEPMATSTREAQQNTWSADKAARAANLRRRREEMILAARKRMEASTQSESN